MFVVYGVGVGEYYELATFDNSGEAREYLQRYTRSEDAGGWDLIEVYDERGEDAERIAFWEREDPDPDRLREDRDERRRLLADY